MGAPHSGAAVVAAGFAQGRFLQLRVAAWTIPAGAADYLLEHHLTGPMFNTYEQGGYLIWRVWPQERMFIDGRSLSETVYRDYNRILFNAGSYADQVAGPREELLNRYGVQVVVMNTMDYVSGALYPLAIALANPISTEWELVYDDSQAVVFLRRPPPGNPRLYQQTRPRAPAHGPRVRGIHRELSRHPFVRADARRLLASQPGEGFSAPHAAPLPLTHETA